MSREWVEKEIFPILNSIKAPIKDQLNTVCEHLAIQISKSLKDQSVLITGGGALNKHLIERIKHYCTANIIIPSTEIINYKVNEYSILAYVPKNVTLAQLCDLIWKYLDDHPENRKRPMSEIYVDAMINIFLH